MSSGLTATPLGGPDEFNWVFLIEILVDGVLALFFLFYFNRLLGTVVSYGIRAWAWHQYKAYIDISALQISPLGGRIFFKSIRYHAHNITLLVHDGHITWRYWLRMVQDAQIFETEDTSKRDEDQDSSADQSDDHGSKSSKKQKPRSQSIGRAEKAGGRAKKQLPCRISVKVSGVEAFIYNRSPLYDGILEQTLKRANSATQSSGVDEKKKTDADPLFTSDSESPNSTSAGKVETRDTASVTSLGGHQDDEIIKGLTLPSWLRVFPIRVECKRAAAVVGNENTTSVITSKVERAVGTVDVGSSGPYDYFKLLFNFDLETINVAMKPNRDFKQRQLSSARQVLREKELEVEPRKGFNSLPVRKARKKWPLSAWLPTRSKGKAGSLRAGSVRSLSSAVQMAQDALPGEAQWHGLARYLDDNVLDEHDEWQGVEYAKASALADIDALTMSFYFDMPGMVPHATNNTHGSLNNSYINDMNGSKPPDYGLDFFVHGGVVTYGPWADRQRINLQQIFFPAPYVDAFPANRLKPGETRTWSLFKIFVSVEKDVVLRIPTRELSKDEKWQGRAEKMKTNLGPDFDEPKGKGKSSKKSKSARRPEDKQTNTSADSRPYGWLDITVKTDTTVNYTMDMFPGSSGYKNTLGVDASGTEIASSVNHGLLWRTGPITVEADLSQPITWKTLRSWPFDITIDDMELFILRDHLFLIIDLVNDWSSGALSEFYTFVPYQYDMHMLFRNFCMYLNVNDANIVNDPANFDRCDFLTLEGFLDANLSVDMTKYRPVRNMITFDVLATNLAMRMLSPPRSTFSAFLKDKQVATLPKLTLSGSYSGHLEQRVGLTDTLRFDIVGSGLSLMAYGFLVRQLVNIKENYFGDYLHFKTLEEFQDADEDLAVANLKTASIPKPKSINELDVILCIIAEDATVMLPTNLYSGEEFVRIELPVANLDLRILSYYLDMGLQLSPIRVLSGRSASDEDESPIESESSTQLFVKHVDLDGHRSFGPPPNEPAYISQWTIDIGAITGEFNSSFLHDLAMAGMAFAFSFPDRENALPLASPTAVNDLTFVQVHTDIVKIWMHLGQDALLFSADPVEVWTNDWARDLFSQRISVLAPKVTLAIVDRYSASRYRTHGKRKSPARTYAFLQTGASVNVTMRVAHFVAERRKQQAHLRMCDQRTNRAPFLLHERYLGSADGAIDQDYEPPCMPYPPLPPPLDEQVSGLRGAASIKSASSGSSRISAQSKSSASSSLSGSIRTTALGIAAPRGQGNDKRPPSHANISEEDRRLSPVSTVTAVEQEGRSSAGLLGSPTHQLPPVTVTFSSSFSEPYFPLHGLEPDETNVPPFETIESAKDDNAEVMSISDAIIDPDMDVDLAQISVFIRLFSGVRAYVEPHVADSVTYLLQNVLPHTPDEMMDSLQMECLGTILDRQERHRGVGKALELNISLPCASFRVINPGMDGHRSDQVDISLRSVEVSLRMRTEISSRGQKDAVAVHATVQNIEASLNANAQVQNKLPAVRVHVKDILVWVAAATVDSIHATVGKTDVIVAGEQAEYLCDLALSLVNLIEHIQTEVQASLRLQRKRLAVLVHALMHNSDEITEPVFLSSLTFLLRAFEGHFRNDDDWKVLMRLHYLLQNLEPNVKHDLYFKTKNADRESLELVTMKELESWAQWRNWDVPNIGETIVFQTVSEHLGAGGMALEVAARALALTVRSEHLRLAVEAAKGANEVVIQGMSLGLEQTPPSRPTGLLLMEENTRKRSLIQVHSSSVAISTDWSAFAVAEAVVPCVGKLQKLIPSGAKSDELPTAKTLDERLSRQEFQLVVSTDRGVISLQTINLRHEAVAERLKVCVIGTTQASERYGPCATVVINAQNATTQLYSQQKRCIWQTNLTLPVIYIDQVHPFSWTDEPPSTVVAVSYENLELAVQEQAPGLLHLIDSVILDEATKIVQLINSSKSSTAPPPDDSLDLGQAVSSTGNAPKIHIALLAGHLKIELALLSTLRYKLEGIAASVRVAPDMAVSNTWCIDFDVGGQTHVFVNSSKNENHEQNILDVPPINGHVAVSMASAATSLSVAATMESIKVDAAAIQGAVGVMNRPEVKQVIETIRASVEDLQRHAQSLDLKPSTTPKPVDSPAKKPLMFDTRFALQGIRVGAETPSTLANSKTELEFGIGPLHAVASNKHAQSQEHILLPEVRAQIRDIGAKLQIVQNGRQIPCGNLNLTIDLLFKAQLDSEGKVERELKIQSNGFEVNAYPHTASTAVDVINHLQDRLKTLDLSVEGHYLRHLRDSRRHSMVQKITRRSIESTDQEIVFSAEDLLSIQTSIEFQNIRVAWLVDQKFAHAKHASVADLIMSLERIELTTRGGHEARLTIEDLQFSLTPKGMDVQKRSSNSALLPNVSFTVGYWTVDQKRSLSFKATGKPLELRLESKFVSPVNAVQNSITAAIEDFKKDTATWEKISTAKGTSREPLFDVKKIGSLLVEADFAGAQVFMRGSNSRDRTSYSTATSAQQYEARHGRYGQFAAEGSSMQTNVQAPGIALKFEYNANKSQPTINGELRIDASRNMLLPNVVPLLKEVSNSVKEVIRSNEEKEVNREAEQVEVKAPQKFFEDDTIVGADPTAIFGKTKVDLGLRICKQEFGLTCQPIARIDATAGLDDLYITMNTVNSEEHGHFFALSATVTKLTAQVKHMYSREPTFSYDMDSIVLSVLNSKHLSGTSGISAILRVNPTKMHINAKQLQDLLLFREIYLPPEIRSATTLAVSSPTVPSPARPEDIFTQRYQAMASAAAFPWNATVSIAELAIDLDLGQSIGKSSFSITNLWASQAKSSNSQQNLCIGMDEMGIKSAGRMSGFVMLSDLAVRTAITWPDSASQVSQTPLIQASIGFQRLRAKAAFDYQAFAFGDIEGLNFLMYNVHDGGDARDRLVAVLDCDKAYVFCTSTSPAQAVGLYQAFDRLIQEKQMAFTQSLKDIEKHQRRESTILPTRFGPAVTHSPVTTKASKTSVSLHTDVVVTIGAISFGVFPSTFFDSQILKLEANNIQARFAVGLEGSKIHSGLGMTLGQLQVALASARRATTVPKALDVSVDDVVNSAVNAKGGIILRVPKVVAAMQTWQEPDSNNVEYIFKSLFSGKIDVGWNLSRINFIKNMWTAQSRALASRLGKALPQSAVKITAGPADPPAGGEESDVQASPSAQQEKITAEVSLPQSRYEYHALEPPIIETPQLRDMGEATPPLEWIGLHRDRLPNVTHQIIIVSLLEVAREVEDAYERILGSS